MTARHVIWLEACDEQCADRVGGKALGLGSLLREGLQVPPGFAVTTDAYRESVVASGMHDRIESELAGAGSIEAIQQASERIRAVLESSELAAGVAGEISSAYARLGQPEPVPVAVRSSATAEDTAEASFAGQQETYLWITGADDVARNVIRCWGSLFTPQAISYRRDRGVPLAKLAMGVVVQRMIPAGVAGVMITIDPVTGDPSQISIEASWGLGLAVVGGEVTPDRFFVDKVTREIRARAVTTKPVAYRFDPAAGEVRLFDVPHQEQDAPCLTDEEVVRIAMLGKRVERALGAPQDMEWAIATNPAGEREVFLLQTRPETVWSRRPKRPIADPGTGVMDRLLAAVQKPVRILDE